MSASPEKSLPQRLWDAMKRLEELGAFDKVGDFDHVFPHHSCDMQVIYERQRGVRIVVTWNGSPGHEDVVLGRSPSWNIPLANVVAHEAAVVEVERLIKAYKDDDEKELPWLHWD